MQHYPLPGSYLGVEYVAILENLVSSTALSIPGLGSKPLWLDVVLEADNLHRGWRVRCDHGYLGWLDSAESADYPQLERLRRAHMVAYTKATIEIVDNALEIAVFLGLAPWQIPVNNPLPGSLLFNSGFPVILHPALNLDVLDALGTRQFICEVSAHGTGFHAKIDGNSIGIFHPPAHVAHVLEQAATKGLKVSARAYSAGGQLALDLPADNQQLYVAPPPPLPCAQPPLPEVAQHSDWEVTVVSSVLAEHVLTPPPRGTRRLEQAPQVPVHAPGNPARI
ncbi:hypothetical protein [Corynebacterium phocae]|uniref:hypothetical protein n=1 Tax=Corynebacterium phocae TaxID=161895 RepID=UPI0009517D2E|nr:hypothetical protein [Corynebacterium phocae]KAA8723147.1 hypothetical protein F4V58_07450 [Corynebacterium phocae]